MKRQKTLSFLLYVFLPLLPGLLIYLLYREGTWLHRYILPASFSPLQKPGGIAGDILVYHLPDFCWCFSLSASLLLLKKYLDISWRYFNTSVLLLLVGSELVQLFFPRHFTFDFWDTGAAVMAFWLSLLLITHRHEKI